MTVEKFKKGFELASTVLVTGAAALLIWTQVQDRWLRPTLIPQPQAVTGLRIDGDRIRNVRGDGDLALVEFTDYECPFCKRHAQTTAVDISREFVTNGLIRHVVFNFPMEQIHARARQAGEAAECAARQGRYWEMHERLSTSSDGLDDAALRHAAAVIGLESGSFVRCLSGEAADQIALDVTEGRRLGVMSTPTFFVGRVRADGSIDLTTRLRGAAPYEVFQSMFERAAKDRGRPLAFARP